MKDRLSEKLRQYCVAALNIFAIVYLLTATAVLPLYNRGTYATIGTDKRQLFMRFLPCFWRLLLPFLALYLVLSAVCLIKRKQLALSFLRGRLRLLNFTDLCVAGYFIAVTVSYFFSDYREAALSGSEGWSMGALTQLSLAAGYFLVTRFWSRKPWPVILALSVSFVLFVLGYLNRFDIWPIPMEVSENRQFISLAGNINWYCGYLVTVLFGAVCAVWYGICPGRLSKIILGTYLWAGFCALVTNGSSSGILTLLVIFPVLLSLSCTDVSRLERFCKILFLFCSACIFTLCVRLLFPEAITYREASDDLFTFTPLPVCLLLFVLTVLFLLRLARKKGGPRPGTLLFLCLVPMFAAALFAVLYFTALCVNTLFPGSIGKLSGLAAFTFSPAWGSRRGAAWSVGFMTWLEQPLSRKLIGVGPDCMGEYLYQDASSKIMILLNTVWPDSHLSNAHCEWLTVLVNLGLLGLFFFVGLTVSSIVRLLRGKNAENDRYRCLAAACGMSVLAYTVHNFVSFQQILNEPVMFALLSAGAAFLRPRRENRLSL